MIFLKIPPFLPLEKSLFSPKMSPGGECVPHPCGSLHASQAAVMSNSSQAIWEQLELTAQGGWWSLALAVMGGMGGLTTDNSLWYQDQILKNLRGKASYTNMQGKEKVEEQGMNKRMENSSWRMCVLTEHSIQLVARQRNLAGEEGLLLMLTSGFT